MKRNALICLFIGIMLLMWVGCDTGSASSADSNTNNTGITNGNGNGNNGNNGGNNNNDENGENNGNDNEDDENGENNDGNDWNDNGDSKNGETNDGDNLNDNDSDDTAPAKILPAPSNIYVFEKTTDSLSVTWSPVTDAYAYFVACGEGTELLNPQTDATMSTQCTFLDLKSDTLYYICVSTYNKDRKVGDDFAYTYTYTKAIYVQPEFLLAPDMYSISFTTNERGLRITWEDSAKSGQYYNLYRANSKNSSYSIIAEGLTDAAYDDLNVDLDTVGNSYFYKVKLVSSSTESDFSFSKGVTMKYPIVEKIYLPSSKKNSSGTLIYYKSGQVKIDGILTSKGDSINNIGLLSVETRYKYDTDKNFASPTTSKWTEWSQQWEFKPSRKYTINILDKTVNYDYNLELE